MNTNPEPLLGQPTFLDALEDELAFAGLPALAQLTRPDREAVISIELSVRAALHMYLHPGRSQDQRRAVAAALNACARYAGICFGPGDAVTVDWWEPAEPDRPEGRVRAVTGNTVTVAWDNGKEERIDATDLRHDHANTTGQLDTAPRQLDQAETDRSQPANSPPHVTPDGAHTRSSIPKPERDRPPSTCRERGTRE